MTQTHHSNYHLFYADFLFIYTIFIYECITDDTTRCKHMIFPAFRIVIAVKYCIVVSRLKPGDRFQQMRIGYVTDWVYVDSSVYLHKTNLKI
jgi:hypothetical protein